MGSILTCPENEIDGIKPIHNVLYVYVIYDIFVIFSLKGVLGCLEGEGKFF